MAAGLAVMAFVGTMMQHLTGASNRSVRVQIYASFNSKALIAIGTLSSFFILGTLSFSRFSCGIVYP
jgi:hypothetical protein